MREIGPTPARRRVPNRVFNGISRYDLVTGILCLCFLLFMGTASALVIYTKARAKSTCLSLGYRGAEIDVSLTVYCVTRVDQTDVVVPIEEAKKGAR
ncbi:hypothetical protein PCO31111_04218 [Pandoraea communis]|uniref:Uncharacterized protein n=1 Tax=Pandoraea communis TaxID=2508297 RepID=A0A5E4XZS8_9BURK|nr:hypothetical protein PCO31111_04218 [Pandoraea communis]